MTRLGIVYICPNCTTRYTPEQMYDLAKEDVEGVVCPACNGYIVDPEGKSQIEQVEVE